ncbi:unnamed protein product [Blumeria hordei]|uniref:Uncharacterized protein n=1 Tax=Blumeria hordei TaxID=2867405 RepID=A0A383V0J2_BLUHO|nr:unnamed protein product [Blumeria hordei]
MMDKDEDVSDEELERRKIISAKRRWEMRQEARLGLPFAIRLPLAVTLGALVGASLGLGHGATVTGLRFRAENAHRLPTSPTGWYLYHKSKNYVTALGGIKEGGRMGLRVGMWTAAFFTIENIFDNWRNEKDFLNTTGGGLAVAGGFSWWSKFLFNQLPNSFIELFSLKPMLTYPNIHCQGRLRLEPPV